VFLKQVIDGERNLTRTMIEKFIHALNLNKKESVFFKNLVLFNQAKEAHEKQEHYSVMLTMMDYVQEYQLKSDQYAYFDKWHNCVIRELVCLRDFNDDFAAIAAAVKPRIRPSEVKKAVQLLLRLNLLEKHDGVYRQTNAAITSNDDMVALTRMKPCLPTFETFRASPWGYRSPATRYCSPKWRRSRSASRPLSIRTIAARRYINSTSSFSR
jgi:uncharacterized protein (TIGR02147 family)